MLPKALTISPSLKSPKPAEIPAFWKRKIIKKFPKCLLEYYKNVFVLPAVDV